MDRTKDTDSRTISLAGETHSFSLSPEGVIKPDIEHVHVDDDPRTWPNARKNVILFIISGASVIAGLSVNIQNPANSTIEQDLHTTASGISLSVSLAILGQGDFPLVWSVLSEIKGRKFVYLVSVALFTVGAAVVAISNTIGLFIGMRVIQSIGSSAVIVTGAATLADIYDPHQRGTMMGIFYSAPLLGPSIGPILGGGLTQGLSWRAIFWFMVMFGGLILAAFLFLFKDTFRKERSLMYQTIVRRHMQVRKPAQKEGESRVSETTEDGASTPRVGVEAESAVASVPSFKDVKLSITDVNPFPPYLQVLSRRNNICILAASGLLFAYSFSISYTCARTLSLRYSYDAMTTGLVLLGYGIGSVLGSILGGRWSDRTLARLKVANGGVSYPEMRLESTKLVMLWFPPVVVGYGWLCQQHVHISAICVMLFFSGFCSIWIYASTLAYIVDANVGRSSNAVAVNSCIRGTSAFVAAEIAVPLQDAIGDGGLYTIWAGLLLLSELLILLVIYKGKRWREARVDAEKRKYGL